MSAELPNADEFRSAIEKCLMGVRSAGGEAIELNAGKLHRKLGGYPGTNHRMPLCCNVMRQMMRSGDTFVSQPPKGDGASLTVRYEIAD